MSQLVNANSIINTTVMVKNIVIGVLIVLCLMSFVYALVQKTDATRAQKEAFSNMELAQRNANEAQHQQAEAVEVLRVAREQQLIAEQNLLECRKNKK